MPSKKIKIGIVQPFINTVGGVEEVISRQVQLLPEFEWTLYGIDFDDELIAKYYSPLVNLQKIRAPNFLKLKLPSRFRRREVLDGLEILAFVALGLGKRIKEEDVLITHYPFSTVVAQYSKKPVIWYCHCLKRYLYEPWIQEEYNRIWGEPSFFYRALRRFLSAVEKKSAKYMNKILCNSNNTRSKLKKYLNQEGEANPPGISISDNQDVTYGDFILLPSRLVHYKRVDIAIEAMRYLPELRLKIVGEGPEKLELKDKVKRFNLKNIEFLEPQASLNELYKNCLAVLCLSRDEDYGLVPREALSWKKPVIAIRDGGGICEVVIDKVNGFLVNADPQEIASRIKELFQNRDLVRNLGRKGFESVNHLSWENHVRRLKEKIFAVLP